MAGWLNTRGLKSSLSALVGFCAMLSLIGAARGQASYQVLHAFARSGERPVSPLVQASDRNFYGTTQGGGANGRGTVFKVDPAGTLTILHSFDCPTEGCQPETGLIQGSDGNFYGTTGIGGAGGGTVFKMDPAGALTILHSFACGADGCEPLGGLIQAGDGSFYGTTGSGGADNGGTVFKLDAAGTFTTVHSFPACINARPDGCQPSVIIQGRDANFYGSTLAGGAFGCGTVFRMDSAGGFTTLHSFVGSGSAEGCEPNALIQAGDGNFYGTTMGAIFKMDSAGALTVLHSFAPCVSNPAEGCQPAGLIQGSDGNFYGTNEGAGAAGGGTAFKMDATGSLTTLHSFACSNTEGCNPGAGLIQSSDGTFYGTASLSAEPDSQGTVFKMDSAGTTTTVHAFGSTAEGYVAVRRLLDGSVPRRLLQAGNVSFYDTTTYGGLAGGGTVFTVDAGGTITTLHSFDCDIEGCSPNSGLIRASDGSFYGTTMFGGVAGGGTVFKMDAAGTLTTLHSFDCAAEGCTPVVGLIQAGDGNFYGTTMGGGAGGGTVFKIDAGGTLTTLHVFTSPGTEGTGPIGLIQGADGNFYGTTSSGAVPTAGAVFKMDAAGTLTVLHSFPCSHSEECKLFSPTLLQASDGNLYGTVSSGAAPDAGIIFKIDSAGSFSTLHSFACSTEGCQPTSFIQAADGNFYGTAQSGGEANQGTIFKMDGSGAVSTLHSFACRTDGCQPNSLIQASDGNLYGTAIAGLAGGGVVFRLTPADPILPVTAALTALAPTQVWISPAKVDLSLDLLAEVFVDGAKAGGGQLDNVTLGGRGTTDAVLYTIPLALAAGPVDFPAGATLEVTVSARRTCSGGSPHNRGKVGLWYNGSPADGGGDAGSRFGATIGSATVDYFLSDGFVLSAEPGTSSELANVAIRSKRSCPARPFTPFGSWRVTP